MAQLIANGAGYAGTVGGTVRVFGTNDVDVIYLVDAAGKISFDGSFNRGGDFIVLPNAAKAYTVLKASGSSVLLDDGDTQITIPVGTKGAIIQFADGELVLRYSGQILLGDQNVLATAQTITAALSAKSQLPTGAGVTGQLIMAANEPVIVGGNVRVFGTNGADTVTVADVAGNISFDGSFNRGGDKIVLGKFAENYSATRPNASNITIGDSDTKITVPLGTKGLSFQFKNEDRTLVYGNSNAYIGNQIISNLGVTLDSYVKNLTFLEISNPIIGGTKDFISEWVNKYPQFNNVVTGMSISTPVFTDVNGDGFVDMILQFAAGIYLTDIGNADRPVEIRIFINNDGKSFTDETEKYIIGSNKLQSISTYPVVFDFNNDGVMDIVYASNKIEGGAIVSNPAFDSYDYFSPLQGFISKDGRYESASFGKPRFWGNISVISIGSKPYIVGSADLPVFDVQYAYAYENGSFVEYDLGLPILQRAYHVLNDSQGNAQYIVQQGNVSSGLDIYSRSGSSSWQLTSNLDMYYPAVSEILVYQTYGSPYKTKVVYIGNESEFGKLDAIVSRNGETIKYPMTNNPEGYYAITPSYIKGRVYSENENSQQFVIIQAELQIIPNYFLNEMESVSADITIDGALQTFNTLIAVSVVDGVARYEKLNIIGKKSTFANDFTIMDINKDGKNDIIVHDFNGFGKPVIYISEGGLNFRIFENEEFDKISKYFHGSSGWVSDFNNDGYVDIISFPSLGQARDLGVSLENVNYYISSNNFGFA